MAKPPFAPKPSPIPLTQAGYDRFSLELESLTKKRSEILIRLQAAREMGDLSENGAYKAARFELSDTDHNIRRLTYLVRYGEVMPIQHNGTVGFGSKVTLTTGANQVVFTIVGEFESDPTKSTLSQESPLGQMILGKKPGDTVTVNSPGGTTIYTILKVE
jgi:transcription elongation factor GreA